MTNKRGDYVPPLLRKAGEAYDGKGRKLDDHADRIIEFRPDATPTPLEVLTDAAAATVLYPQSADTAQAKAVVEAAFRIAQRYPVLRKQGVNSGMVALTTTDYVIMARLALGLET